MIKSNYPPNYQTWRYGEDGPGGGSLPYNVMQTGAIAPFAPMHARRDISVPNISAMTRVPVARQAQFQAQGPAQAPQTEAASSMSVAPAPADMGMGIVLGADAAGRPVRHFDVPAEAGPASVPQAQRSVEALRRIATIMRDQNVPNLAPPLVSGPLAALARGEAIVLRWPNGTAIQAAL